MPILSCSAGTCVYNKEALCSKGDILVGREEAQQCVETCCASFREEKEGSMSNSTGCGCGTIDVDCEVCSCTHNKSEKCSADAIEIAGQGACECEETECGTYHNKNQ